VDDEAGESTEVVMTALWEVLETHGIPGALYTDRASWAVYTPTSGTAPERSKLTQVGRALATLGIEHIVGFSPQARGRSERANGTLQGRLVNELRTAGVTTRPGATKATRSAQGMSMDHGACVPCVIRSRLAMQFGVSSADHASSPCRCRRDGPAL